jgi:hypothetical protein
MNDKDGTPIETTNKTLEQREVLKANAPTIRRTLAVELVENLMKSRW